MKELVLVMGLVLPMMASGLEDLGVFVSGFGLVMKSKPKQGDEENNEEKKTSLIYWPILKLAHWLAPTLYESLSLKH